MTNYIPQAFIRGQISYYDYLKLFKMMQEKNLDADSEDYFLKNDQNKPRLSKGGFMLKYEFTTKMDLDTIIIMFQQLQKTHNMSILQVNDIFEFGAKKYNGFNFILDDKKSLENKIDRLYNAYLRHVKASGNIDYESGRYHEDHAGACLVMMYYTLLKYYKPYVEYSNLTNTKPINIDFDGTLISGVENMFADRGYYTQFTYYNEVLDKLPDFAKIYKEYMRENYSRMKPIVNLKKLRRAICHMVLCGYKLRIVTNHYAGKEIVEKWVNEVLKIKIPVMYVSNIKDKLNYTGYFIDDYPFTSLKNLYLVDYPYNSYVENCTRVIDIIQAFKKILEKDNKKTFYP